MLFAPLVYGGRALWLKVYYRDPVLEVWFTLVLCSKCGIHPEVTLCLCSWYDIKVLKHFFFFLPISHWFSLVFKILVKNGDDIAFFYLILEHWWPQETYACMQCSFDPFCWNVHCRWHCSDFFSGDHNFFTSIALGWELSVWFFRASSTYPIDCWHRFPTVWKLWENI